MVAAIVYDAIVLLYYSMKYGGLYVDCHVAMTIVTVFYVSQFLMMNLKKYLHKNNLLHF